MPSKKNFFDHFLASVKLLKENVRNFQKTVNLLLMR